MMQQEKHNEKKPANPGSNGLHKKVEEEDPPSESEVGDIDEEMEDSTLLVER